MKYLLLLIPMLVLSSVIYSQPYANKSFTLKGKVMGADTGFIHIGYVNSSGKYVNDSCYLNNGAFEFTGFINGPTLAGIYGKRKSRSVDDPNVTEIFIEPVPMNAVLKVDEF